MNKNNEFSLFGNEIKDMKNKLKNTNLNLFFNLCPGFDINLIFEELKFNGNRNKSIIVLEENDFMWFLRNFENSNLKKIINETKNSEYINRDESNDLIRMNIKDLYDKFFEIDLERIEMFIFINFSFFNYFYESVLFQLRKFKRIIYLGYFMKGISDICRWFSKDSCFINIDMLKKYNLKVKSFEDRNNDFLFENSLNNKIIGEINLNEKILIICSTFKSQEKCCKEIYKNLESLENNLENLETEKYKNLEHKNDKNLENKKYMNLENKKYMNLENKNVKNDRNLGTEIKKYMNFRLENVFSKNIFYYHGKLSNETKIFIEKKIKNLSNYIICSTASILKIQNLKFDKIIFKSTKKYTWEGYVEYNREDIISLMNILSYKTKGNIILYTKSNMKSYYDEFIVGRNVTKSFLYLNIENFILFNLKNKHYLTFKNICEIFKRSYLFFHFEKYQNIYSNIKNIELTIYKTLKDLNSDQIIFLENSRSLNNAKIFLKSFLFTTLDYKTIRMILEFKENNLKMYLKYFCTPKIFQDLNLEKINTTVFKEIIDGKMEKRKTLEEKFYFLIYLLIHKNLLDLKDQTKFFIRIIVEHFVKIINIFIFLNKRTLKIFFVRNLLTIKAKLSYFLEDQHIKVNTNSEFKEDSLILKNTYFEIILNKNIEIKIYESSLKTEDFTVFISNDVNFKIINCKGDSLFENIYLKNISELYLQFYKTHAYNIFFRINFNKKEAEIIDSSKFYLENIFFKYSFSKNTANQIKSKQETTEYLEEENKNPNILYKTEDCKEIIVKENMNLNLFYKNNPNLNEMIVKENMNLSGTYKANPNLNEIIVKENMNLSGTYKNNPNINEIIVKENMNLSGTYKKNITKKLKIKSEKEFKNLKIQFFELN